MNRQKLTELVNNPAKITQRDIALLRDMAGQYPYTTVIQILLAKSKQQQADAREALATAALYTPNRQVLRQVIEDRLPPLRTENSKREHIPLPSFPPPGKADAAYVVEEETTAGVSGSTSPAESSESSFFAEEIKEQTKPSPESNEQADISEQEEKYGSGIPEATTGESPSIEYKGEEEEQPPQSPTDVFEELQKNLKRLRNQRTKWQDTDDKLEHDRLKEGNQPSTGKLPDSPVPPAIQQVVEAHQQQPLENPRVQEQRSLIDSFLENASNLQRRQAQSAGNEEKIPDLSESANLTPQDLATETLAKIMERQGKIEKAIDIYQKLLLKFPQKSAYFADCIERLKKEL